MAFILFQWRQARQFLDRAGDRRQRLANLVGDRRRKAPQRGHAILSLNFLFQPAQIRQVLEVEDVSGRFLVARTQWRGRNSQKALLAVSRRKINLVARNAIWIGIRAPRRPETRPKSLDQLASNVSKTIAGDFLRSPVE